MQNLIATTFEVVHYIALQAVHYKPLQEVHLSRYNHIDRKICINRSLNHYLEAMAKQLYDYWFVQFDFPDENGRPYKSSGSKMVWNDKLKREIPENWTNYTVENIEKNIITGKKLCP